MNIRFKKVILHNFLSFGHSEINLEDRGHCLVMGINKCPKDNTYSNGSGKSSWISGICWALTGETIQGVTKNIKNMFIDENSCYVELEFNVDSDEYKIIRYNKPKSDLKVYVNGEDKSGKGVRESELQLAILLPDINRDLISNVILLGQGLPNKLSSHSPSGRKELLEKFSKSDFMIETLKNKVTSRETYLTGLIRKCEDIRLSKTSELNVYKAQLVDAEDALNNFIFENYDEKIKEKTAIVEKCNHEITVIIEKQNEKASIVGEKEREVTECYNSMLEVDLTLNEQFKPITDAYNEEVIKLTSDINALEISIRDIDNIRDVCPTCGQKLQNVIKPDSTALKESQISKKEQRFKLDTEYKEKLKNHQILVSEKKSEINNKYQSLLAEVKKVKDELQELERELSSLMQTKSTNEQEIKYLEEKKATESDRYNELQTRVSNLKINIETISKVIEDNEKELEENNLHIDVIKKMQTLLKRDFRGYLLQNVISFIDRKCKEYSLDVFKTTELDFVLDGNDIDILYCEKPFESLSGGEKQKVDIILQFAVRDLMKTFLNFSSNILALDEIFDALDSKGTEDILNLIERRIQDVDSLFIISHHADELNISADSVLTIVKSDEGISEVK